jgi:hypothetical protein
VRARQPRLKLAFESVIFLNNPEQEYELFDLLEGRTIYAPSIQWLTDIRIINTGRVRVQINGLRLTQDRDGAGMRGWDATNRLGHGVWIEPGETVNYQFTDVDLDEARLAVPIKVSVLAAHDQTFEVTGTITNKQAATVLPYGRLKEIWGQLGLDELKVYVLDTGDID